MSRSRRKKPFMGIAGGVKPSEKKDKKANHSRLRSRLRDELKKGDDEGLLDIDNKDVSDPWAMSKDGKTRFDPKAHPKLMRK